MIPIIAVVAKFVVDVVSFNSSLDVSWNICLHSQLNFLNLARLYSYSIKGQTLGGQDQNN